MARRIRRAKDKEDIFQELGGPSSRLFESMKEVFLFAAALGYSRGRREPLRGGIETFGPGVFSNDDMRILHLLGVAHSGSIDILRPDHEEELLSVAEEYANAGILVLKSAVLDAPGDPLDNLIGLIVREARQYGDSKSTADRIAERLT